MNAKKKAKKNHRGLRQNQLIMLILLVAFVGIGIYYYILDYQKHSGLSPVTGPFACPIEPKLAQATRKTRSLVYGGLPISKNAKLKILQNIGYYTGYCEKRKNPLWVAYRIDGNNQHYKLKRPSRFKVDFRTFSRINPNDYKACGYDRGHLAPNFAISSQYGRKAQLETFLMSNIVPQSPNLNRKVWQRLEKIENDYAQRFETVWVIAGPIFDQHIQYIKNQIEVPDALFKILFDEQKGTIRVLSFIIPQTVQGNEPINRFLTSIDEVEKLTGLDFLAPLSDENENKLEAAVANSLW